MGKVVRIVLIVLALIVVALGATVAALHRGDLPLETLKQRYASPASRYLELSDGVVMHYREGGDREKPPVVLIHGFAASSDTWAEWERILAPRYRLISLDLPGHGLTSAPPGYQPSIDRYVAHVQEAAGRLGLQRFAIVGSSMGGNVAWRYAATHPDRTMALVLVAAAGWPAEAGDGADGPPIFALMRTPVIGPILRDLDTTALTRQGLEKSFVKTSLVDDEMVNRYVEMSRGPGRRAILMTLLTSRDTRAPASAAALAPIRAPTLILHGDRDPVVPVSAADKFEAAIRGSVKQVWSGVGHLPQEEIPGLSAAELDRFLTAVLEQEPPGLTAP